MTCDKCGRPGTVHVTKIAGGTRIAHYCEECAAATGDHGWLDVDAIEDLMKRVKERRRLRGHDEGSAPSA